MKNNKCKMLHDEFEWIAPQNRKSRFLQPYLGKLETRKPLLWLCCRGDELYLVNLSGETLDEVVAGTGGFITFDDDVAAVSSEDDSYVYKNVKPKDAVKVDEYNIYDQDYVLQTCISIKSEAFGCFNLSSPAEKGGIFEVVLLWDTLEAGRHCYAERVS